MARCGNGHESSTDDYCDVCGTPMGAAGGGAPAAAPGPAAAPAAQTCGSCGQAMLSGARFCEQCGWDAEAATLGGDPLPPPEPGPPDPAPPSPSPSPSPPASPAAPDGAAPSSATAPTSGATPAPGSPPAAPASTVSAPAAPWQVVAFADREYFDTVQAMDGADVSSLTFPAFWPQRHFPLHGERILIGRQSRSRGIDPEIDLGGQFTDPGISALHAMLIAQPGGGWAVCDLGSSNGTYLNDQPEPLEPHVPVPVSERDKIHIGAWTTLSLHLA